MNPITPETHPHKIAIDCSPVFQERVQLSLTVPYWGWMERVFTKVILDVLRYIADCPEEIARVTLCTRFALLDPDVGATAKERTRRINLRITREDYTLKTTVLTSNYPGHEQRIFRGVIHAFLTAFEAVPVENQELFLGYVTTGHVAYTDIPMLSTVVEASIS